MTHERFKFKLEGDSRSAGRSGSGDCSGPSCRRFWKESVDSASLSVSFVLFPTLFQFFRSRRPTLYFHSFRFFNDTCNLMNKGLQIFFGFVRRGVLVSACSTPISLPWMNFGWSRPGDAKSSGMLCVRVGVLCVERWRFPEDLCKDNQKVINFEFLWVMVDLTVQCFEVLVDLSSNNDLERF